MKRFFIRTVLELLVMMVGEVNRGQMDDIVLWAEDEVLDHPAHWVDRFLLRVEYGDDYFYGGMVSMDEWRIRAVGWMVVLRVRV